MAIKILTEENKILLKTKNTLYAMELLYGKYPVHLYYGKNVKNPDLTFQNRYLSFSPYYEEHGTKFSPDTAMMEYPFFGMGDFRASALRIYDTVGGSDITDFSFRKAKKKRGRPALSGLPYAEGSCETLELIFDDKVTGAELRLYYTVFPDSDVISRYFTLKNKGKHTLSIEKAMSLALDIPEGDYDVISFQSQYAHERSFQREMLCQGNRRITSRRGSSSHQANPFFMIADRKATETKGTAYGFNFVYSGSYLDEIEQDQNGTVRVMVGLGDELFRYRLEPGEEFTSPEAVMTYSSHGLGEVSRNMHRFTRNHILPPDVFSLRPVVLNSWEAFYFNINEELMVDFAKAAAECGMDMLVMDDGWFGDRRNDRAGLGDWVPCPELFPNGLASFVDRVRAQGIRFGIWIEPEMVNPDSNLYRTHPDWVLSCDGRERMLSRHQLVLDMANSEVVEYLKASLDKCFEGVHIDYFKWDMNRNMSHPESPYLPPERKRESSYRYMLGVYELYRWLRERFPDAMIENCSGGGGRFDLGMMKYSTQIWTSDNTKPQERVLIQYGTSFGYPSSVMSCHVANRRSEATDKRCMDFGYKVALGGPLGYEFNILTLSDEVKADIKKQIADYRQFEKLILNGELYRLKSPYEDGCYAYYYTKKDYTEFLLFYLQPKGDEKERTHKLKVAGAIRGVTYRDTLSGMEISGNELRRGLVVQADREDNYAKLFHFKLHGSDLKL